MAGKRDAMLVYLEAEGSQAIMRRPAESVRMAIYAENNADSGGVEIRVERKKNGSLAVVVNRYEPAGDGRLDYWRTMASFDVPARPKQ